jgi:hypothetical protein
VRHYERKTHKICDIVIYGSKTKATGLVPFVFPIQNAHSD